MHIDEAIKAYASISTQAFSERAFFESQEARTRKLEDMLRAIVRSKTGNGEAFMLSESKCRV